MMTRLRVRWAALVNSVRTRAIMIRPRLGAPTRVAGREEIQERVFEPLCRHDRLQSEAGADQCGGEVGAMAVVQLDNQPVALELHAGDDRQRVRAPTRPGRGRRLRRRRSPAVPISSLTVPFATS